MIEVTIVQLIDMLHACGRYRHDHPILGRITVLEHLTQIATRARNAGADPELVACALIHDAAVPIDVMHHAHIISRMMYARVTGPRYALLRAHSHQQAKINHHRVPDIGLSTFAAWDYASYDPTYPTDPLESFHPELEALLAP